MTNKELIHQFYTAFQQRDAEAMAACYHDDATFYDPAFGQLSCSQARNMWRMLTAQAGKDLTVRYQDVWVKNDIGGCKWEADYTFSKTGNKVNNRITANFKFKDGKIISHIDHFNFWKWSRMALGTLGIFLGFTPLLKNKVRKQARHALQKFESSQ